MVLLEESHAAVHSYPEHEYLALDIFACGSIDPSTVMDALVSELDPTAVDVRTLARTPRALEQDFNSLDAQREACAAYVTSQKAEGWVLLPTVYEDAGISGGTLERPGLQRLLADIDAGLVDQIVVYKVDRLTRSLSDFAKLVERLEAAGAVFVSVTQSFNTATSMGRLTLHMLLSFAQFEREVTAERIRDKGRCLQAQGTMDGRPRTARL